LALADLRYIEIYDCQVILLDNACARPAIQQASAPPIANHGMSSADLQLVQISFVAYTETISMNMNKWRLLAKTHFKQALDGDIAMR
jgi:hypothetical protein